MFSIKKKLVLLISACTLLGALLLGGGSIIRITKVIDRSSQDTLQLQCRATKESLDMMIGNIKQGVDSMKDAILSELNGIERLSSDAVYRDAFIHQVLLTNRTIIWQTRGCSAYYFWLNPEIAPAQSGYFWVYDPHYTRFLYKKVPDVSLYTEYDFAQAGRFYTPRKNGVATWISPYYDELTQSTVVSYVVPIYVRGTFLGVIGMDITNETIETEVKSIHLYKTGYAYLLDQNNRAVYHKDYDPGDLVFIFKNNVRSYSLKLSNGWELSVIAPNREINAERRTLILVLMVSTLLVAGIFIFISVRSTERIIRPLMDMIAATRKLAEGDLNVQLPVDSNDEVGMLAKSFSEAIQRLPNYLYRDSLTGVSNVSAYKLTVADLQKRIEQKDKQPFAVIVFDINNLKLTNDKYGHEAGNDLITTSVSLICDVFKHCRVFRIGGDEFVAVLEWAAYENRAALIAEFTERLDRIAIFVGKEKLPVSVALGIAEYTSTDTTYDDIFNRADEAMYENKKAIKAQRHMPSR